MSDAKELCESDKLFAKGAVLLFGIIGATAFFVISAVLAIPFCVIAGAVVGPIWFIIYRVVPIIGYAWAQDLAVSHD